MISLISANVPPINRVQFKMYLSQAGELFLISSSITGHACQKLRPVGSRMMLLPWPRQMSFHFRVFHTALLDSSVNTGCQWTAVDGSGHVQGAFLVLEMTLTSVYTWQGVGEFQGPASDREMAFDVVQRICQSTPSSTATAPHTE